MYFCHVSRVLQKTHWKISLLVTFFVCCWAFMYRYFNIFANFGRNVFPATVDGPFLRMLNKQARLLKKKQEVDKDLSVYVLKLQDA